EGHGGSMETKVHQPFSDVFFTDAAGFFQRTQIQQAFVSHKTMGAFIKNRVMVTQFLRHVVSVKNRVFGSLTHASLAHHPDIHPRSEEHTSELQSRENLVCRLLLEKKK